MRVRQEQVLDAIERETGERLPGVMGPQRAGDPAELVADPARARRELGFAPSRSDLETIVRTAWACHRWAHPKRNTAAAFSAMPGG